MQGANARLTKRSWPFHVFISINSDPYPAHFRTNNHQMPGLGSDLSEQQRTANIAKKKYRGMFEIRSPKTWQVQEKMVSKL